ncbi:hypothetical protein [Caminibacter pacificus]
MNKLLEKLLEEFGSSKNLAYKLILKIIMMMMQREYLIWLENGNLSEKFLKNGKIF